MDQFLAYFQVEQGGTTFEGDLRERSELISANNKSFLL